MTIYILVLIKDKGYLWTGEEDGNRQSFQKWQVILGAEFETHYRSLDFRGSVPALSENKDLLMYL